MKQRTVASLLPWLALVIAAGALGALASREAASFYAQLSRPSWAPPAGIFGPVWTALYLMMGVAAWRVATALAQRQPGLALFLAQLAANVLWSWLFFAWHLGGVAFADILLLDALVIATIVAFWRADRAAAALLLPYLGWIGFATALNWVVWQGNPALLG
ncbi:MAG: tryptophan-rich sensory protein [Burkholderiales bacterium]|nr:tryptophan-rich sensory protein [Burkholderiales bacterium]